MSDAPGFGETLARLRRCSGKSQTRLAEVLCELSGRSTVTRHEISRYERGLRLPGPFWLPYLAEALEVPVATLERATATGHLPEEFTNDLGETLVDLGNEDAIGIERRQLLRDLAALGICISPTSGALQSIRDGVDTALGRDGSSHLDDWEAAIVEYGYTYLAVPPHRLFADLAADLVSVQDIMRGVTKGDRRYPGWCRVTSGLAVLIAKTLCNLDQTRDARPWWATAQYAADASRDADLSLWITGERLIHKFYEGVPAELLLRQATDAISRLSGSPGVGLAKVRGARAQALAQLGRSGEAVEETKRTEEVFTHLPSEVTRDLGSVTSWGEDRLRYIETWVYAHAGDDDRLDTAAEMASRLYPATTSRGPAQIKLLQALGHVRSGDVTEGVASAGVTYTGLPTDQRTTIITRLATHVLQAVPETLRSTSNVTTYRELLAASSAPKAIT